MTSADVSIGTTALRKIIDQSGYGAFVSDQQLTQGVVAVLNAVDAERLKIQVQSGTAAVSK